jgi:hypothetical protein
MDLVCERLREQAIHTCFVSTVGRHRAEHAREGTRGSPHVDEAHRRRHRVESDRTRHVRVEGDDLKWSKQVVLPDGVDATSVRATAKDGILNIAAKKKVPPVAARTSVAVLEA